MASSSSNAHQLQSADGVRQVPGFPFVVIQGGEQGEDINVPSTSSHTPHTRSRSTPEHALATLPPPGLPQRSQSLNVSQNNTAQAQFNYNVRQSIAEIEQRMVQLTQMQMQNNQTQNQNHNAYVWFIVPKSLGYFLHTSN